MEPTKVQEMLALNKSLETLQKVIEDQQNLILTLTKIITESKNESTMVLSRIMDGLTNVWGQMLAEQIKEKQKEEQEGKPNIDEHSGHVDLPRSGPT